MSLKKNLASSHLISAVVTKFLRDLPTMWLFATIFI